MTYLINKLTIEYTKSGARGKGRSFWSVNLPHGSMCGYALST